MHAPPGGMARGRQVHVRRIRSAARKRSWTATEANAQAGPGTWPPAGGVFLGDWPPASSRPHGAGVAQRSRGESPGTEVTPQPTTQSWLGAHTNETCTYQPCYPVWCSRSQSTSSSCYHFCRDKMQNAKKTTKKNIHEPTLIAGNARIIASYLSCAQPNFDMFYQCLITTLARGD